MGKKNIEKEQLWRGHIDAAANHAGSVASYCRMAGVSPHTFKYWKNRFEDVARPMSKGLRANFIPVEVLPKTRTAIPDPRWVAELILRLHSSE